jgi:hypothetical protein
MQKTFPERFREAVTWVFISAVATVAPCAIFGVLGTMLAASIWQHDNIAKLISWSILAGAMLMYALVDRVAVRAYSRLTSYTFRTGRLDLDFSGLVDVLFYSWGSTDMRPRPTRRPRAFYYNS